jgi:acetyl esterase/lipase
MNPRALFLLAVLSGILLCPAQAQQLQKKSGQAALPAGVGSIEGIEYAKHSGISLQLDLYRPKDANGPVPAIVFVHGGGWKNGSRKSGKRCVWLVPEGFAIASISYRLTDNGQWPDQINDCYAAVRWVRKNAKEYGLDPKNVGCWGTSAGGHLVALMGTRDYKGEEEISSKVQAVCDWFGPTELLTMPPNNVDNGRTEEDIAKSNGAKLLGATVRDVPKLAKDASALDNVSKEDAAFLIMHGDADKGVPLEQSQKLHDKLVANGVPSQLIVLKGAGHGGKQFDSPESRQAVLEFFTKTLKPGN